MAISTGEAWRKKTYTKEKAQTLRNTFQPKLAKGYFLTYILIESQNPQKAPWVIYVTAQTPRNYL